MKNFLIVLTLILGVSIFSSCTKEECETCEYHFMWVDAATDYVVTEADSAAMNTVMAPFADMASGELCDDALTDAKDAFDALPDSVPTSGVAGDSPAWAIEMHCEEEEE